MARTGSQTEEVKLAGWKMRSAQGLRKTEGKAEATEALVTAK